MPDDNGVITISEYKREIIRCVSELDNDVLGVVKDKLQGTHTYEDDGAKLLTFIDRVFIVGNGGSHAIAEHISTDLNKRCKVKAYTLSNNSLQTALTNDYSQEDALVEWLKMNGFNKTDYLVAISSSGKSKNILNAIYYANDFDARTLSIFGMDGAPPFSPGTSQHDYIHIDSYNYGVVELTSEIILHGIVEELVVE